MVVGVAPPLVAGEGKAAAGGAQAIETTAGEVAKNPGKFYGKKVKVTAEVEDVYSAHAFTLDEDAMFAGPDVLVLIPAPTRESKDGEDMTVTGIVRQHTRTELERDYKWFDYTWFQPSDTATTLATRPVLVADSVRTSGGEELVRAGNASMSAGDQPLRDDKKPMKKKPVQDQIH
jgi:hypothetical protein